VHSAHHVRDRRRTGPVRKKQKVTDRVTSGTVGDRGRRIDLAPGPL